MSRVTQVLSLDFGSACIRAARTSLLSVEISSLCPQVLEFGSHRALRNAVLLEGRDSARPELGDEAFDSGLAFERPQDLLLHVPLGAEPDSDVGRGVDHVLARLRQVACLDNLAENQFQEWCTIVARPHGADPSTDRDIEQRLREAGFPSPRVADPALAALAWCTRDGLLPGTYLVVDCGAGATRVTLCGFEVQEPTASVVYAGTGVPGSRDFDRAIRSLLLRHHPSIEDASLDGALELLCFSEACKERVSQSWADGEIECANRIPNTRSTFDLTVDEFREQNAAGRLISQFGETVTRILGEAQCVPSDLTGVVLAGGGAQWPFVQEWVNATFGADRVVAEQSEQFPEERIVRGLAVLSAHASELKDSIARPVPVPRPVPRPNPSSGPRPKQRVRKQLDPKKVFRWELVGGLFGVLGLGWGFVLGKLPIGCLAFLVWVSILGVVIAAGALLGGWPLLALVVLWPGVPLLSAWLARQRAVAHNKQIAALIAVQDGQRAPPAIP